MKYQMQIVLSLTTEQVMALLGEGRVAIEALPAEELIAENQSENPAGVQDPPAANGALPQPILRPRGRKARQCKHPKRAISTPYSGAKKGVCNLCGKHVLQRSHKSDERGEWKKWETA